MTYYRATVCRKGTVAGVVWYFVSAVQRDAALRIAREDGRMHAVPSGDVDLPVHPQSGIVGDASEFADWLRSAYV